MDSIKLVKGDVILVADTMYVFVREAKGTLHIRPFALRFNSDLRMLTTCPRHIFDIMSAQQSDAWGLVGNIERVHKLG